MSRPTVALVKGRDRYRNISEALALLGKEAVCGARHVIKPNFVSVEVQQASTHREAVRAVLDFVRRHSDSPVIIAEGAAASDTFKGYENFGFMGLAEKYDGIEFRDLNRDAYEVITLYDQDFKVTPVRVAKTILESDNRISLTIPKTHDTAIVTLGLKNMAVGSLIRDMKPSLTNVVSRVCDRLLSLVPSWMKPLFSFQTLSHLGFARLSGSDKVKLHQGYLNMHLFLYQLVRIIPPHLCVLDGFTAMEGNGPVSGGRVDWHVAIAGTDPVAVDTLAAYLMGFDPQSIGYLYFCSRDELGQGDISKINMVGTPLEECRRSFKPHRSYGAQLGWKKKGISVFEKLSESMGSGLDIGH
jgi:uncharacterized protein (DUF362 family)